MRSILRTLMLTGLMAASCVTLAAAQGPTTTAALASIPIKVQVTISRLQNDKKISSTPYTLSVLANDTQPTNLSTGLAVPLPGGDGKITYQNIGTSISADARRVDDGRFRLRLNVNDSSLAPSREMKGPTLVELAASPTIKSFQTNTYLLLRDGQPMEFVAAADPLTGEVTRIEVTLTVLK